MTSLRRPPILPLVKSLIICHLSTPCLTPSLSEFTFLNLRPLLPPLSPISLSRTTSINGRLSPSLLLPPHLQFNHPVNILPFVLLTYPSLLPPCLPASLPPCLSPTSLGSVFNHLVTPLPPSLTTSPLSLIVQLLKII